MNNRIEQSVYPHANFGIDFSNAIGPSTTQSGREVEIRLEYGYISVRDSNDPYYEMQALVDDGELSFRTFTRRLDTRERHPDMFASKFVETALQNFESQGVEINACNSRWNYGFDTYNKYMKLLGMGMSQVEAATLMLHPALKERGFCVESEKDVRVTDFGGKVSDFVAVRFKRKSSIDVKNAA